MIQDIAPRCFQNQYLDVKPKASDFILCYRDWNLLIKIKRKTDDQISYPAFSELELHNPGLAHACRYLFAIDDERYFLAQDLTIPDHGPFEWISVRSFRMDFPGHRAFAGISGHQLYNWYRDNRLCGRCGKPLIHSEKSRSLTCPGCGRRIHPQICPAVIVGITNGTRLLLRPFEDHAGRSSYALFSGFAEIGESIEETVRREVMEEVGLRVKNLRFYKSQPWSFTETLLMGFYCDLDGSDEVHADHNEVEWARWFDREEIDVEPNGLSLTNEMIVHFKECEAV